MIGVNVMDYGATGDGVTDDSTAIQAAVDDCSTNKLGIVYFPPGTYRCSFILRPGVRLVGAGSYFDGIGDQTILKGLDTSTDIITFGSPGGFSMNFGIEHMALADGRHAIAVISQGVVNLVVRNVRMGGCSGAGLYSDTWMERCVFDRVETVGCQWGFRLVDNGTINNYWDKLTFTNIRGGGTRNLFRIESHRACNNITLQDVVANGVGEDSIYVAAQISYLTVLNYSSEVIGTSAPANLAVTTGSMTNGSSNLTVVSATNFTVSDTVTVRGAGSNGMDLISTVSSKVGNTLTLADPAVLSVAGADVTNAVYSDIVFRAGSAGGNSTEVTIVGAQFGSAGALDKTRYALENADGAEITLISSGWNRSVRDPRMQCALITTHGPVIMPTTALNTAPFVYSKLTAGNGVKTVLPGVPGKGTVLSLRGDGSANENTGTYGKVTFIRTDPNRNTTFEHDADQLSNWYPAGSTINLGGVGTFQGATNAIGLNETAAAPTNAPGPTGGILYVQGGNLKFRRGISADGVTFDTTQQAAISSPAADAAALKVAVDALIATMQNAGLIAPP